MPGRLKPRLHSYFIAGLTLARNRLILFVYLGDRFELPIRLFPEPDKPIVRRTSCKPLIRRWIRSPNPFLTQCDAGQAR